MTLGEIAGGLVVFVPCLLLCRAHLRRTEAMAELVEALDRRSAHPGRVMWSPVAAATLHDDRAGCREEIDVNERRTDWARDDVDRRAVVVAALLTAIGGLVALTGLAVAATALAAAGRRWYRRVDLAPEELARLKWEQARAAVRAGADAWQETESDRYAPRSARREG